MQELEEAKNACVLFVARALHHIDDKSAGPAHNSNQGLPLTRIVTTSATK